MKSSLLSRRQVLSLLPLAAAPTLALADSKPVEWVVGYAPGGGSDTVARMLAEAMGKSMGQSFIVINKPGAGSNIAADYVAKSRDAEHMVFTADSAVIAANPFLYSKLTYSAEKDFAPVGTIARFPLVLVVSPGAKPRNLKEFLAWARSEPGAVAYGSPGTGSPHHLATELFRQQTGLKLTHVPYRGAAPAIADVIGGQLPFMFVDTSSGGSFISSGKVRAIGVASAQRLATTPDLPTLAEQGLPGFEADSWFAIFAPANTPKDVIARLNAELNRIYTLPDVQAKLKTLGLDPVLGTPEKLASYQRSEIAKWAKVVKESGAKAE